MPDINLTPDDYRVQTKRGRWINRDRGIMVVFAAVLCFGMLTFIWWHRAEAGLALGFCCTVIVSVAFGLILGAWLKRFD
jgi:ABC-type proline/glycine betaine transport system permease subunit